MKRLGAVVLILLGVGLIGLGLLFAMAAGGGSHRLLIGVAALASGAVASGIGLRLYKQADAASPAQLRAEILELARRRNGEISQTDVQALLGRRSAGAAEVLAELVADKQCSRSVKDGTDYYLFADLQPRVMIRRCEFCRAQLPLSEELLSCPECGGTFDLKVERRSLSQDDAYSMDE